MPYPPRGPCGFADLLGGRFRLDELEEIDDGDRTDDGTHLVSAEGRSLYLFTSDQGTTSACGSGCLENWPPLVAAVPTAGDGVDAGLLSSAAGAVADQVTYSGHLLYYFAGDLVPGDANGVGIPNWYLVDPAGNAIDGS